jgi:hypothetical protein
MAFGAAEIVLGSAIGCFPPLDRFMHTVFAPPAVVIAGEVFFEVAADAEPGRLLNSLRYAA